MLDLNTGLTQVLDDGTNTYLYGNGRIGELQPGGFAYHLGDALGSVRQLTDDDTEVTMARSFEPFGSELTSAGDGSTVYQYTGEVRDASGLTFLRARYLSAVLGRFTSRDSWAGEFSSPLSLNGWNYVEGNPINRTDPSGHDWRYPTAVEGTAIHKMIEFDFKSWGIEAGRLVDFEVPIIAASKQQSTLIKTETGYIRMPFPDNDDPEMGKADLIEYGSPSFVYEIKTVRSARTAIADAQWYQYHLNIDNDLLVYGPWYLGIAYLAEYKGVGKYIGFWPNDPDHVVLAEQWASGAIVYWGKEAKKVRQPNFKTADEYERYLAYLAALAAAGAAAANEIGKGKSPKPRHAFDPLEFMDSLCQPPFFQIGFELKPFHLQPSIQP